MTKRLLADDEIERLDRFELIAEIASGGMATVFLGRLSGVAGFQRLVAIKRLHPHLAREPEFVEMFLDEARLAARIRHPNVVPIQEVGHGDRGYYLVMDYVEGDTLARLLARAAEKKKRIPHGVSIRAILDVLAGLHAAHELQDDRGAPLAIVHRDVSPQNVIVGVDGVARLVDFGVARAASRLATTRSGQLKGKLAYMAPEQARGGPLDRRADVFSCGVVLWETLAMKRLFKGETDAATLTRVLYDPIPTPGSVRADVPKALERLCMKALEREPDARFATAQEFADELEREARDLSCVGSAREVAACLEELVGAELTEQREAVRTWFAQTDSGAPRPLAPRFASSSSRIQARGPGSDDDATLTDTPAETVSSVSSAVLRPPSTAPAPRSRSGLVLVALAAAVLGGAGVWGATRWPTPAAPVPVSAAPIATPSAVPTAVIPVVVVSAPLPSSSASTAPIAKPPTFPRPLSIVPTR